MNLSINPRILAALAVVVVGLVAIVGWYGLVAPQHSKADRLDTEIAATQAELKVAQLLARSQKADKSKASGVTLLAKAMPPSLQMPAIVRQVQKLAESSNVTVASFTPSAPTALSGYDAVPIDVNVTGRYADVERFIHRLRVQADSAGGRIKAAGRLFDVQTIGLTPGGAGAPELTASLRLATFVYTGVPLAVPTTTETTETSTESGGTP